MAPKRACAYPTLRPSTATVRRPANSAAMLTPAPRSAVHCVHAGPQTPKRQSGSISLITAAWLW